MFRYPLTWPKRIRFGVMPIALFPTVIFQSDQPTRTVPGSEWTLKTFGAVQTYGPGAEAFDDVGAGLAGVRSGSVPRYRHGEELGRRAPTALRQLGGLGR